jgi:hypothetical protein
VPRVDDDPVGDVPRLVDPVDELSLVVALPHLNGAAQLLRERLEADPDVVERLAPVDAGFPSPQQVEAGTVEHEHAFVRHRPPTPRDRFGTPAAHLPRGDW